MDELKPCPFCGNKFPTITETQTEGVRIKCQYCEIEFTRDFYQHRGELGRKRTIEAWNRRANDAELLELCKGLLIVKEDAK
nr:MAG TPA: restriction alleviation protein [Caudoviricetes sp.]